jgi:hypothetical protein
MKTCFLIRFHVKHYFMTEEALVVEPFVLFVMMTSSEPCHGAPCHALSTIGKFLMIMIAPMWYGSV